MQIKKILCPTDFSEAAEKAFEYALFLASVHQAEVALLHVVGQLHGFEHYEILAMTPKEIAERLARKAREKLEDRVGMVKDVPAATEDIREGKPWVEICKAAEEGRADIIVMGSRGRTGLSQVLIGSVAEAVVRHASCPVLVVR